MRARTGTRTKAATLMAAAAVLVVGWATAAAAHITIEPVAVPPGAYTQISVRVPNERSDTATTTIRMQFPQDQPISSVSVRPTPGWTATVATRPVTPAPDAEGNQLTEAVDTVTWEGGRIEPDQYQDFDLLVGPLPAEAQTLYFPAIQIYEDGEEVAWIERPSETETAPPFPAPQLALVPGVGLAVDEHGNVIGGADTPTSTVDDGSAPPTTSAATSAAGQVAAPASTTAAEGSSPLGGLALGIAVVALVLGVVALGLQLRARPTNSSDAGN